MNEHHPEDESPAPGDQPSSDSADSGNSAEPDAAQTPPNPEPAPAATAPNQPAADTPGKPNSDEQMMGLLSHILGLVTSFVGPLIVWLIKKDESEYIAHHAKEALNFQLTVLIISIALSVGTAIVSAILPFGPCITAPVVGLLGVADVVLSIMATVAASNGERYVYPLSIRLVK